MNSLLRVVVPPRSRLLAGLGGLLASLADPLHPVIEQVAGLDGEIDLVARDERGRAVAVRLAEPGEDLAALADLLAQCDWLRPRLRDWLKLNPALAVEPELGVRGLLLAPEFGARTLAAARRIGDADLALARVSAFEWQGALQLALEPIGRAEAWTEAPQSPRDPEPRPPAPAPTVTRGGNGATRESFRHESVLERAVRGPLETLGSSLAQVGPEIAARESRFRTGLRDDELGLPRRPRSAPRG